MNKEDKKLQEDLVNEMMEVSKTNPDVMIYMQSLMECYEDLEEENKKLKELYETQISFNKEFLNKFAKKDRTLNELRSWNVCKNK